MYIRTSLIPFLAVLRLGLAADCFSQSGSQRCGTREGITEGASAFCNNFAPFRTGQDSFIDRTNSFRFSVSNTAKINPDICLNAANDIINQCLGSREQGRR